MDTKPKSSSTNQSPRLSQTVGRHHISTIAKFTIEPFFVPPRVRADRVNASKRLFGIWFSLYYTWLLKIGSRLQRAANPIEATTFTAHGVTYDAFRTIFKSFDIVAGESDRKRQFKAMSRGQHSQRGLSIEPKREVRELTVFSGERLQLWLNYRIIHRTNFFGQNNIVCLPGGTLAMVRKIRATYINSNDVTRKVNFTYWFVHILLGDIVRVQPDSDFPDADHQRLEAAVPGFRRRLVAANISHPSCPAAIPNEQPPSLEHENFGADVNYDSSNEYNRDVPDDELPHVPHDYTESGEYCNGAAESIWDDPYPVTVIPPSPVPSAPDATTAATMDDIDPTALHDFARDAGLEDDDTDLINMFRDYQKNSFV